MKQYEVELTINTSLIVTVEAENEETAEDSITSQHIHDALYEQGYSVDWVVDEVTLITEEEND